ncbi:MAG: DUF2177 family protein [Alphaproteobacteria bacterium]
MTYVALYVVTMIVFLGVDALWLKYVMNPLFQAHIGDLMAPELRLWVAGLFYLFYIAGIIYFAQLPGLRSGSMQLVLINGAILGFLAYGTYEATNMATLRGWSWSMVAVDVAWGTFLTAMSAWVGLTVVKALGLAGN